MQKNETEKQSILNAADQLIKALEEAKRDIQGNSFTDVLDSYAFISALYHTVDFSIMISKIGYITGIEKFQNPDCFLYQTKTRHPLFAVTEDEDEN